MSDSQSGGMGFESRADHYLDLFLGSPEFKFSARLVNSQLVCLRPVGILKNVMFSLNYLFQLFARPPRVNKGIIFLMVYLNGHPLRVMRTRNSSYRGTF